MTDSECKSLPITHKYLKKFIFTGEVPGGVLRQVMHLLHYDGLTYMLVDEAFDLTTAQILVCVGCVNDLKYTLRKKKLPIQTIAYHDLGRLPSYIPKLTSTERLAIAKVLVFAPIFELKPVQGARATGLKGNVVAIPLNSQDSLRSVVTSLPRLDLAQRVKVTIIAKRSMWKLAKNIVRKGPLSLKLQPILLVLRFLKEIKAPDYVDINIPTSDKEIAQTGQMLHNTVTEILNAATCSSSGLISEMADHVRTHNEDVQDGTDESPGTRLHNVLLTDGPTVMEPMDAALRNLQHKMNSIDAEGSDDFQ